MTTSKKNKGKKIKAWAGFRDGEIVEVMDFPSYKSGIYQVFSTKKGAKVHYEDVRKVEILIPPKKN